MYENTIELMSVGPFICFKYWIISHPYFSTFHSNVSFIKLWFDLIWIFPNVWLQDGQLLVSVLTEHRQLTLNLKSTYFSQDEFGLHYIWSESVFLIYYSYLKRFLIICWVIMSPIKGRGTNFKPCKTYNSVSDWVIKIGKKAKLF